jgi:hypothetical protein
MGEGGEDTEPFNPLLAPTTPSERRAGRFGFEEPAAFDPQPPPLPASTAGVAGARRRGETLGHRTVALVVVVGALITGIVLEGPTRRPGGASVTSTVASSPVAVAVGEGPTAPKAFYCPEGTTLPGAEELLALVNTGRSDITARLTFLIAGGNPSPVPIAVVAGSRLSVRVNDYVQASGVATLVEADGPGLAVAETLYADREGRRGTLHSLCAAQVATRWYFAGGTTAKGYELWLLLVNPFPEDAVVDVTLVADGEQVVPPDFQQRPVPARSRVSVPIHETVLRKDRVATTVTATRGRIAAAESSYLTEGVQGAALTIGVAAPASTWYFADGIAGPDLSSTISVFNPSDVEATARVDLTTDSGEAMTASALTVAPHDRTDLRLAAGLRPGTSFATRVTASAPVVAMSEQLATRPTSGYLLSEGTQRPERSWLIPEAGAGPPADSSVSLMNPGTAPVHLSIGSLEKGSIRVPANAAAIEVLPGRRRTLRIGELFSGAALSLILRADGPIVAACSTSLVTPRYGSTAVPGVPIEGLLSFPDIRVPAKPPPLPPAPSATGTAGPGSTTTAAPGSTTTAELTTTATDTSPPSTG